MLTLILGLCLFIAGKKLFVDEFHGALIIKYLILISLPLAWLAFQKVQIALPELLLLDCVVFTLPLKLMINNAFG